MTSDSTDDIFTTWLTDQGYKPDFVIRESQLIPVCDEVLKLLSENSKLKSQLVDYVKAKKYPCSLFIAAWYLLRLGYIEHPIFNARLTANKLLNILPESFRPFEEKAWEIIKEAGYEKELNNISYRWIEGRLIV